MRVNFIENNYEYYELQFCIQSCSFSKTKAQRHSEHITSIFIIEE